jgi:23S rRNA pseudouridine2605 synthase
MAKRSSAGRPGSRTNSNSSAKKSFSRKSDQKRSGSAPRPFRESGEGKGPKSEFRKRPAGKFDKDRSESAPQKDSRPSYGRKKFDSAPPRGGFKKSGSRDASDKPFAAKRPRFRSEDNTGSGDTTVSPRKFSKGKFDKDGSENAPQKDSRPRGGFKKSGSRDASDKPFAAKKPGFRSEENKRSSDTPAYPRKFSKGREEPFEKKSFSKKEHSTGDKSSTQLRRERPYKNPERKSDIPEKKYSSSDIKKPAFRPKNESRAGGHGTRQDIDAPVPTGKIRLNKFIANSGVCSRREADELITMGLISVNGKTITELGYKVNPGDEVRHESKILRAEKPVYILMNKPKGFLTTTSDPQERNTVMHLIANAVKERVYPVGRLDRNTTGLLLLTNDGDLADKLMHPSYNAKKIYRVELDRALTKADAQAILEGVKLEEGRAVVDDLAILSDDKKTVGLEIHIGWNRVVRRIFESLNYEVLKLDRSVYAGLDKKNLGRGEWRFLTKEELVHLKHYK